MMEQELMLAGFFVRLRRKFIFEKGVGGLHESEASNWKRR
jgi:hypothetical protein